MFDLVHERSRVHRFTRLNLLKIVTLLTKKKTYLNIFIFPRKGLVTRITPVKYQSSSTNCSKVISKIKFSKMVQTSKSRSQGKKSWYPQKGLVTRNTHMKYQSSSTHCQKLLARLKFQRE